MTAIDEFGDMANQNIGYYAANGHNAQGEPKYNPVVFLIHCAVAAKMQKIINAKGDDDVSSLQIIVLDISSTITQDDKITWNGFSPPIKLVRPLYDMGTLYAYVIYT